MPKRRSSHRSGSDFTFPGVITSTARIQICQYGPEPTRARFQSHQYRRAVPVVGLSCRTAGLTISDSQII